MTFRLKRGSVVLVALSCVTVLGIAMASFLAVSNQAMKLSNRAYAKTVSKQLAEMGLERALRSFNSNSFTALDGWTLSGITATRNISIPTGRYGTSGITATAKVRVEHYLAARKATMWSRFTAYSAGDFVWYQGVWYLYTAATSMPATAPPNQLPSNTTYWKAAPESWNAYAHYQVGNIALSGGSAYRCISDNINQPPPNATYWTAYAVAAWDLSTTYAVDTVVLSGGLAYRCIAANTGQKPPNTSYWLSAPVIYSEGSAALPDNAATTLKTQLRATLAPAPLFPNGIAATTLATFASTGVVNSYNSSLGEYTYNQTTSPFSTGSPNIGSSAVVAGGNTGGNAVAITNVRVNGYLAAPSAATAPYAPRYTNSTSGIVTSIPAPTTPGTKIDLSRISRSPYIPQFDLQTVVGAVSLPAPSSGSTIADGVTTTLGTPGTPGVTNAPIVYNVTRSMTGASFYSGLYLSEAADQLIIDGPVILYVTGTYFGMGLGKITIKPGASLEIYLNISGQIYMGLSSGGGIDNQTNDPSRLFIASANSTNTVNYYYLQYNSATLPFMGTFYMPNGYVTVAASNIPIYGAISAKNVNFSSVTNFHYDTALRNAGSVGTFVDDAYRLVEWRELTDPVEKITLP